MAWFHPIGIVKSSRRHKLRSEASARFEKGADPEIVDLAMRRFAELLGAPLEDGVALATGTLPERPPVRLRPSRVTKLPGSEIRPERMAALLHPIGFTPTPAGAARKSAGEGTRVSHRVDLGGTRITKKKK